MLRVPSDDGPGSQSNKWLRANLDDLASQQLPSGSTGRFFGILVVDVVESLESSMAQSGVGVGEDDEGKGGLGGQVRDV